MLKLYKFKITLYYRLIRKKMVKEYFIMRKLKKKRKIIGPIGLIQIFNLLYLVSEDL